LTVTKTNFRHLLIIEPRIFHDERGYFFESWNQQEFAREGIPDIFIQDNQSGSAKNVIRGLHFQVPPHEQGKLVRTLAGSVLDIVVDLRKDEPTYGQYFTLVMKASDHNMLFIPPGFAHGFLTLEDHTIFAYKCTKSYHAASERSIRWDDPDLAIDWGVDAPILSEKDRKAGYFKDFKSPF
jgi:dTDP-4-dehydrorhamnose 3,5-epimerase